MAIFAMNLPLIGARLPFDGFELDQGDARPSGGERPAASATTPFAALCAMLHKCGPLAARSELPDNLDGRHRRNAAMASSDVLQRGASPAERDPLRRPHSGVDARMQAMADALGLGLWAEDAQGAEAAALEWNDRMYGLYGRDRSEGPAAFDEWLTHHVHPLDREWLRREVMQASQCWQPSHRAEFRTIRSDGTVRWIQAWTWRETSDGCRRSFGVHVDVTDQRRAEAAVRDAACAERANRAKSAFVTCLSHELRTPLNAVLGFGQLLLEDASDPLSARQRARLEHVRSAAGHMLALINQTLDLASIEAQRQPLASEPVALADCVREAVSWVEPVAGARGITVREEGLEGCVLADARRLRQVAANLVSNAVKYNRPGGWVVVQARRRVHEGREQCALVVRDSGRGLTCDQIQRLFEPFNRLGAEREGIEGTGMGLAIARQLVQRMGGDVEVESEAGVGSEFRVWLPAAART